MRTELLIGGAWRQGADGGRIVVTDPTTTETITEVADGTPADALAACDAAEVAEVECLGREGSTDGIYEFCETQYIATSW